jgi:photosystem II stability/assembly factor-like uncharacterized protein
MKRFLLFTLSILCTILGTSPTARAGTNVWTSIGPDGGSIQGIAVDPQNPDTVYALAAGAIFKTTDGAENWARVYPAATSGGASNPAVAVVINPQDSNAVYAGTANGVIKSADGGANWTRDGSPRAGGVALAIDPRNPNTLYAWGTYSPPDGVFKSTDGGASWIAANSGFPPGYDEIVSLTIDPQTPDTLYASVGGCHTTPCTYSGVFKSTDGGTTWTGSRLAYSTPPTVLALDPINPKTVYAATYSGVAKSLDAGTSWNAANSGLTASQIDSLTADPQRTRGITQYTSSAFRNSSGSCRRASWNLVFGANQRNYEMPRSCIVSAVVDPWNPSTLFVWACLPDGRSQGLFKSIDGGQTWSTLGNPLTSGLFGALAIDPQNSGTLYVSGFYDGVLKTTDGGQNWKAFTFTSGLPATGISIRSIAVDPQNSNIVYAASYGLGVYWSTNGGANWKPLNAGLADLNVQNLLINTRNTETVYAGSYEGGVFAMTFAGQP